MDGSFDALAFRLLEGGPWRTKGWCGLYDAGSQGLARGLRGAPVGARHGEPQWGSTSYIRTAGSQSPSHSAGGPSD